MLNNICVYTVYKYIHNITLPLHSLTYVMAGHNLSRIHENENE